MKRSVSRFLPILIILFGIGYLPPVYGAHVARIGLSIESAVAAEGRLADLDETTAATAKSGAPRKAKGFQLEGQNGILSPVNPGLCCAGTFSANLAGTPNRGAGILSLNITAGSSPDPLTNCNPITGSGTINNSQFTVELFSGELCGGTAHPVRYTLTGTIGIYAGTGECPGVSGQPQTAMAGALVAYGAVHVPGNSTNPVPGSASSLVSIAGTGGAIPLCVP